MPRIKNGLPKDPDQNGLFHISRELATDPLRKRVVIAVVDCSQVTLDTTTGAQEPTVRICRIELVHPDDQGEAERLVRRALEYRMGDEVLPIDIERDLEAWFDKGYAIDTTTGELTPPDPDTNNE